MKSELASCDRGRDRDRAPVVPLIPKSERGYGLSRSHLTWASVFNGHAASGIFGTKDVDGGLKILHFFTILDNVQHGVFMPSTNADGYGAWTFEEGWDRCCPT